MQVLEKEGEDMLQRYDEECAKWQRMAEAKEGCSASALSIYEANNRAKLETLNPRYVCVRAHLHAELQHVLGKCTRWPKASVHKGVDRYIMHIVDTYNMHIVS